MDKIHNLTTEQLRKIVEAFGGINGWPSHTDDPEVNYAVDCIFSGDDTPEYDEELYRAEVHAAERTYGPAPVSS